MVAETDSSEMTLETGNYKYQFNFLLPDSLPSSYCHKYGEVKYFVEATISRNRKPNYVSKVAFTVNGILDLNKESEAAREGEMSNEKVRLVSTYRTIDDYDYYQGGTNITWLATFGWMSRSCVVSAVRVVRSDFTSNCRKKDSSPVRE